MSQRLTTSQRQFNRQQQNHRSCHQHQPWHAGHHHQRSGRRSHHQHHRRNRQCYRCGESFTLSHLSSCRARFVRCFSCHNFGHFSFMCVNRHRYVSFVSASRSRRQNSCKLSNHRYVQKTDSSTNTSDDFIIYQIQSAEASMQNNTIADESESLAQELPYATIDEDAIRCEISAKDREFRLETKLCAVMDRMEEDKILHSMEMLSILDRVTSVREQLTKCEEEKDTISQEYQNVKTILEDTCVDNKPLKAECNKLNEKLSNIRTDNTISMNSITKIEGELEQFRKDLEEAQEQLSKSREENERINYELEGYKRDFSELCHENNFNVTQHNTILEELETLKKEKTHSVNSISKFEEVKQSWDAESNKLKKTIAQLQDERDYFEERYETYAADNQRAVERRIEMEAEIKRLKRQRNQYQRRN